MKNLKLKMLSIFALSALSVSSLNAVDIPSYSLVDEDAGDFNIVKYVENADGSYSAVTYGVSFGTSDIGDTDGSNGTYYYLWSDDLGAYTTTGASVDNYDIVVTGNAVRDANLTNTELGNKTDGYYVFASKGTASLDGGAFVNTNNLSEGLTGVFVGNMAGSGDSTVGYGGAISITSNNLTGTLTGIFISNTNTSANDKNVVGGAIHIGAAYTLTNVQADFIANYAKNTSTAATAAQGGAINNVGTVKSAQGDFIVNYASSNSGNALGGAIFNSGTVTYLSGDFIGNYATTATGIARGGAIYNSKTITELSGDFFSNYAIVTGETGTAQGGAIYNTSAGTITFNASTESMQFTGNYVVDASGAKTSNAIYNAGELNFNSSAVYKIVVNDGINGDSEAFGKMNINSGTTVLNNVVSSQTITVADGAILELGSVYMDSTAYAANLSASTLNLDSGSTLSFVVAESKYSTNSITLGTVYLGGTSGADGSSLASAASLENAVTALNVSFALDLSTIYGEFEFTINLADATDAAVLYSFLDTDLDVVIAGLTISEFDDGSIYANAVADGEGNLLAEFEIEYIEDNSYITISGFTTAVPEPSTYAMIFGAIALGFAYYRRRK